MIKLTFSNREVKIAKESNVKYVAQLSNFHSRFVFERSFINKDTIVTHDNAFILEVVSQDKKIKEYYKVDSKAKIFEKVSYDSIKSEMKEDMSTFGRKYFF